MVNLNTNRAVVLVFMIRFISDSIWFPMASIFFGLYSDDGTLNRVRRVPMALISLIFLYNTMPLLAK